MSVIITYFCPEVDQKVDELVLSNQKEKLASFIDAVNGVDELFNSFAIAHKGAPVALNGGYGIIEIDPEGLKDLHQLAQTAKGLIAQDIAIGVGKDLKTAAIACVFCMNRRGSEKPVVYQPSMDQEMGPANEEVVKAEAEPQNDAPAEGGEDQDIMGLIAAALDQVRSQKHAIEQMREVNPDAYEAVKGIIQALIIMSQTMVGESDQAESEAPVTKAELDKSNTKLFAPTSPGPVRRQSGKGPRRRLIPGTMKGGKKKVIDPVSGKSKWQVAAPKRHANVTKKPPTPSTSKPK